MSKQIFILVLSILSTQLSAQQTIFELYDLPKEGCDVSALPSKEDKIEMEEYPDMMMDEEVEMAESETPLEQKTEETFDQFLPKLKERLAINSKYTIEESESALTYPMTSGNYCFREKGKWGVKKATGEILLTAKFDFVKTDTIQHGFVGYIGDLCNYYDGNTGKKLLKQDFYDIIPSKHKMFRVQTLAGYDIYEIGKGLRKFPEGYIRSLAVSDEYLYTVSPDDGSENQLYLPGHSKPLFLSGSFELTNYGNYPLFLNKKYFAFKSKVINLKKKKQLVCSYKYLIDILSSKTPVASIQYFESDKMYLIDLDGNIISKDVFSSIRYFDENGEAVATKFVDETFQKRKTGIIDETGKWVVEPIYQSLQKQGDIYIAMDITRTSHILDAKTKTKLFSGEKSQSMVRLKEDLIFVSRHNQASKVVNYKTGEIVKADLSSTNLMKVKNCSANGFYINTTQARKKGVLDDKFETLIEANHKSIHRETYGFRMYNYDETIKIYQSSIYNCQGEIFEVVINGQTVNQFKQIYEIEPGFYHCETLDGQFYFINEDGTSVKSTYKWKRIQKANYKDFYIAFTRAGNAGLINRTGEEIMPPLCDYIVPYNEESGLFYFKTKEGKPGYFDKDGQLLFAGLYDEMQYIGKGLYLVSKDKISNIINVKGETVIEVEQGFSFVRLTGGIVAVHRRGKEPLRYAISGKPIIR